MPNGQNLVTLNEVAERANTDPKFFKDIVEHLTNPNAALARYNMRLSREDEAKLSAGLRAIRAVEMEFEAFGGWGRWPTFHF